jgi:hypothetical protein
VSGYSKEKMSEWETQGHVPPLLRPVAWCFLLRLPPRMSPVKSRRSYRKDCFQGSCFQRDLADWSVSGKERIRDVERRGVVERSHCRIVGCR